MNAIVNFSRGMIICLIITLWSSASFAEAKPSILTLTTAIHEAISREPTLQQAQASADALTQEAVANGQLPDPKLTLGVANVPTDDFTLTHDDMTMTEIGVSQYFPAGHALSDKSKQTQALSFAAEQRQREMTLTLIQQVSNTWLELYYAVQAKDSIQKQQQLLKSIVHATEAQYATEKTSQQIVLQTQLESSELEDKQFQLQQQIESLRAILSRWIGDEAMRPLGTEIPEFSTPSLIELKKGLLTHPLLTGDNDRIEAARQEMAWNKEQYKPGFDVGVGYGARQGSPSHGMRRSDFVSAEVTMDLPVFTRNRQDKRLKASEDKLVAAELNRQIHYRDLSAQLSEQYALWQKLNQRALLYKKSIIPKAAQNAKAALLAYQSAAGDFINVIQANRLILDLRLAQLRIQVDCRKAQINLNYLRGVLI
ncbi:MAG: hypothetical protein A2X77_04640 [Gammaproteobacteria bacterium GWE2_42_36]|nr:MAG: hypothetical protein A2X77_04640 [Gammaproteobacteria bacterium GWE2_42_36]